jgi:hypothetical protein
MTAIFQNTSHALHVSFLVMAHEPRQATSLCRALLQMMEAIEKPTRMQLDWMARLRGDGKGGTVDFGGLTGDEIRAQCAMITQTVRDHLTVPEQAVILCRYAIQLEKAKGVADLAAYVQPMLDFSDDISIKALVYGHLQPHQRKKGLSYQEISAERGISVKTLRNAAAIIAKTAARLEAMAIDRLAPMFLRDGVIYTREEERIAA